MVSGTFRSKVSGTFSAFSAGSSGACRAQRDGLDGSWAVGGVSGRGRGVSGGFVCGGGGVSLPVPTGGLVCVRGAGRTAPVGGVAGRSGTVVPRVPASGVFVRGPA